MHCIERDNIYRKKMKEKEELKWCSAASVLWCCSNAKQEGTLEGLTPVACVRSVKQLMLSREQHFC